MCEWNSNGDLTFTVIIVSLSCLVNLQLNIVFRDSGAPEVELTPFVDCLDTFDTDRRE